MKKFSILRHSKGFMLTELMVVLALLGIVLALGYMFYGFGTRAFSTGEKRAIAQQSVRTGADFITRQIRFADELTLDPSGETIGYYYIYQDGNSVHYKYIDPDGSDDIDRVLLDSAADEIGYAVSFDAIETSSPAYALLVTFTITAEDIYSLSTDVYIMNITKSDNYTDNSSLGTSVSAVEFKKPN